MASKTVKELEAEVERLTVQNRELAAQVERLAQPVWVDQGAEEFAQYLYDRMPGLKVSSFLGGPSLSPPVKVMTGKRSTMLLTLNTTDGRVYGIEVYRTGDGEK
jgi:hypothetical protein